MVCADNWDHVLDDPAPRAVRWATRTLQSRMNEPDWGRWHYTEGNGCFTACGVPVVPFMVDNSPQEKEVRAVTCKRCLVRMKQALSVVGAPSYGSSAIGLNTGLTKMSEEVRKIEATRAGLLAAGFLPVRYAGDEGVFYRRDTRVETMPYLGRQVDNEVIFGSCVAITEVRPDGMVQLHVHETDYSEEAVDARSDEGQGLLRDAADGQAEGRLIELGQTLVESTLR